MDTVQPTKVSWLWEPYVPVGKLALLDGDPGIGKSWVALSLAASVSRGRSFADDRRHGSRPRSVLYVAAEDDPADTLRPRLESVDADLSRVFVMSADAVWHGEGGLGFIRRVDQHLGRTRAQLLVIDPLHAVLGSVGATQQGSVRQFLMCLGDVASRRSCAVLCIRHRGKSRRQGAIHSGLGSVDFVAAARSVLLACRHPADPTRVVIAQAKSSLGPQDASHVFAIFQPGVDWCGRLEVSADDLVSGVTSLPRSGAAEFLRAQLENVEQASTDVFRAGRDAGFSERTLRRAKRTLRIEAVRRAQRDAPRGSGQWVWRLIDQDGHTWEDAVWPS